MSYKLFAKTLAVLTVLNLFGAAVWAADAASSATGQNKTGKCVRTAVRKEKSVRVQIGTDKNGQPIYSGAAN